MQYVRPRLNDYHNLPFTQEEVDFAIPFVTEDIPLIVDPFLLWKSPSLQDNALHTAITNCFNHLGHLFKTGKADDAVKILIATSECDEVGLGSSRTRKGRPIGQTTADDILNLFSVIPQLGVSGFVHFEELQLFVDQVAKDRICDFTCSFAKSFLVDFTMQNCAKWGIPRTDTKITVYDYRSHSIIEEPALLPSCPTTNEPILFVPKRWLRYNPWITYDDYFDACYTKDILKPGDPAPPRAAILEFNRHNYGVVCSYIKNHSCPKSRF